MNDDLSYNTIPCVLDPFSSMDVWMYGWMDVFCICNFYPDVIQTYLAMKSSLSETQVILIAVLLLFSSDNLICFVTLLQDNLSIVFR